MPNFRSNEDLCKLCKEYLNDVLCNFGPFCLQHSKTFDISHAFLRVTIVINAQTGPVFLAHPVFTSRISNYGTSNYRLWKLSSTQVPVWNCCCEYYYIIVPFCFGVTMLKDVFLYCGKK